MTGPDRPPMQLDLPLAELMDLLDGDLDLDLDRADQRSARPRASMDPARERNRRYA